MKKLKKTDIAFIAFLVSYPLVLYLAIQLFYVEVAILSWLWDKIRAWFETDYL